MYSNWPVVALPSSPPLYKCVVFRGYLINYKTAAQLDEARRSITHMILRGEPVRGYQVWEAARDH